MSDLPDASNQNLTTPLPSVAPTSDGPPAPPCSVCGSTEPPDAAGLCPVKRCRCFRKGNSLASVHDGRAKLTPADLSARDALMARLFRERGGREALDIVSQLRVEDYATAQVQLGKVTRRLEQMGAVSEAGNKRSSLVDTYNTFSARVERLAAELPPPVTSANTSSDYADIDGMNTEQLIAKTTEILHHLLERRDATPVSDNKPSAAGHLVQAAASTTSEGAAPTVAPAPAPAPPCPYCRRECVGPEHRAFDVLHWDDPEEIERRRQKATAEMMRQIGQPLPAWYRE